ncbi:MAG TPA: hypothetical protein VJT49_18995 [Amycolatopsis sp.]|uniref:hypothetical protein n=1 Tax=Amycolatopsis sp. TaxID=37632 RepID=UPI002B48911A|nr:hypothetical protein [Amycolatopsis sp.]HKS47154.1 hypothetical protein [Amycolatopsis sp.]
MNRLEEAAKKSHIERLAAPDSETLVACTLALVFAGAAVACAGAGFGVLHSVLGKHLVVERIPETTPSHADTMSADDLIAQLPA